MALNLLCAPDFTEHGTHFPRRRTPLSRTPSFSDPVPKPERRTANTSELQIQQQLEIVVQTCEVLNLRMQEFEQVLLELDQRVRRLQAAAARARMPRQPATPPASRRARRRQRPRKPARWRRLVLLLVPAVAMLWLLISRYQSIATATIDLKQGQLNNADRSLELQVEARGSTWLEVQNDSGKTLHYGMMKPGILRFPVISTLRIRAGRPDLVEIQFQGRRQSLGTVNDMGWKQFNLN